MQFEERDAADHQASLPGNWSKSYDQVRSQSLLAQPDREAFYAGRARLLLGSYRRDDASNPDLYVQAITLVLSEFPEVCAEYVTDPRCGIQSQEKFRSFPPNSGEVKAACEAEMARAARMQQPVSRHLSRPYIAPPNFPGCRTNMFIHEGHPNCAILREWAASGAADSRDWKNDESGRPGIWVALSIWEGIGGLRSFAKRLDYAAVGLREAESSRV